jgi:hypothetical protein
MRSMAEEEGFEPPVDLRPRLISSQVPLTTLSHSSEVNDGSYPGVKTRRCHRC